MARWSSWGAVPEVFDLGKPEWENDRQRLREALTEREYEAAANTTRNAHYTSPAYVSAMWTALSDLGLSGGTVLEPGCGTGTFIGLAPDDTTMLGVELDPITARIASHLYPQADIRTESFADTRLPARSLDAVIGNVPFSKVALHDPVANRGKHSMHNHFIIKSLMATRPGGVVAVLSSHFTMDATNPAARREMNEMADLLGAVRLPTGAHRRTAGTEAVTDLLVFRRREPGQAPASTVWETTGPLKFDDTVKRVNNYFIDHPDMVLGTMGIGRGMHGSDTLTVKAEDLESVADGLRTALSGITADARANGLAYSPATGQSLDTSAVMRSDTAPDVGHIAISGSAFTVMNAEGHAEPYPIPRTQHVEARSLLELRDGIRELIAVQIAVADDTPELVSMRQRLHDSYVRYRDTYGPINRFTEQDTRRVDKSTGDTVHGKARRFPPVMNAVRSDPFFPQVMALENFDQSSGTATPAAILTTRTSYPRRATLGAETASEALAVCIDTYGEADLDQIATLLGVEAGEARAELGELVYDDPGSGRLVTAAEYLSGNVRLKLDSAVEAAQADSDRYSANVAALKAVQPRWLGSDEIRVSMGASWIPAETHQQFLAEILNDQTIVVENPGGSTWGVKGGRNTVAATAVWGTERRPAPALAKSILEQSPIRVYDKIDEKNYLNEVETVAAQEKAQALQERFSDWVWENPKRARALETSYNHRLNSMVARDYSEAGKSLTLPGLVSDFVPLPHQRTAVARMIAEPSVGLFHQVGAGKTAEMVIGAMELKRLGLVTKPAIVVPNHMLEQFSREFLQLYPGAKILAAGKEQLESRRRREFVARITANDWDAVIMTRTAFAKLPLAMTAQRDYQDRQKAKLKATLDNAQASGTGLTTKRLATKLASFEAKMEAQLKAGEGKDPGVTFEETGIDYLFIDEAHEYKNLMTASNISAANIEGSARAADLHMKIDHLRHQHGGRVVTLATATPIANSMSEAHVMLRYLRPDLLVDAGIEDFDSFASTFTRVRTRIEIDPTGSFRMAERFDQFINVPELQRLWTIAGDIKTEKELNLPVPLIREREDGQRAPEVIVVPQSNELGDYMAQVAERNERIKAKAVPLEEDNILKLSRNAQSAALDMRLVDPDMGPTSTPTKAEVAADKVHSLWLANRDQEYIDKRTGEISPRSGALQLVFCDLSTPSNTRWDFYNELRSQLVARGMPAGQIKFIHEAEKDSEKAALFADCRNGTVSVLIGSTQKMGTGTNVQDRIIGIHEIDAPWRPADVTQRRGRGVRQGNLNPEIGLYIYTTSNSFDSYTWQTIERKSDFINTLANASPDMREVEDIGDDTISYAEVKAITTGDPLVLEKATADAEMAKLEKAERAYHRKLAMLGSQIADDLLTIGKAEEDIPLLEAAIERTRAPFDSPDQWRGGVDQALYSSRADAAMGLDQWAQKNVAQWEYTSRDLGEKVAVVRGHFFNARQLSRGRGEAPTIELSIHGVPARRVAIAVPLESIRQHSTGTLIKMENRIDALPATLARIKREQAEAEDHIKQAEGARAMPFDIESVNAARARCDAINRQIEARAAELSAAPPDVEPVLTIENVAAINAELERTYASGSISGDEYRSGKASIKLGLDEGGWTWDDLAEHAGEQPAEGSDDTTSTVDPALPPLDLTGAHRAVDLENQKGAVPGKKPTQAPRIK